MATWDGQVGLGADDGFSSGGGFYPSDAQIYMGNVAGVNDGWVRVTGVSGLSGVTIDVSYCQNYARDLSSGTALLKVRADDSAAPTAPTTRAEHTGKTRTTAGVDWDITWNLTEWKTSPSLNTVIQELADSYDPSAIQLLIDDDGSGSNVYGSCRSFEFDTTLAAKLHIEYTAGGAARRIFVVS